MPFIDIPHTNRSINTDAIDEIYIQEPFLSVFDNTYSVIFVMGPICGCHTRKEIVYGKFRNYQDAVKAKSYLINLIDGNNNNNKVEAEEQPKVDVVVTVHEKEEMTVVTV